jgi:hypothetical protein
MSPAVETIGDNKIFILHHNYESLARKVMLINRGTFKYSAVYRNEKDHETNGISIILSALEKFIEILGMPKRNDILKIHDKSTRRGK